MGYISEEEYNARLVKIQKNNESRERKRMLKEAKNKDKPKGRFKLPPTSKLVLMTVFVICIEIIIFAQYAMIKLNDASAMYTLIGVPVALVPTILGYYHKSTKENTQGGIVYDTTMAERACDVGENNTLGGC